MIFSEPPIFLFYPDAFLGADREEKWGSYHEYAIEYRTLSGKQRPGAAALNSDYVGTVIPDNFWVMMNYLTIIEL